MTATIQPIDLPAWRRLAPGFADYNYRQLWSFGERCAARVGAHVERLALRDGGDVLGLAEVRVRRLPFVGGGVAYLSGGPLVRRGDQPGADDYARCLSLLRDRYVRDRGLVLRVAPPPASPDVLASWPSMFVSLGFVPSPRARTYRTLLLDLAPPAEVLRSRFHKKWRNCLSQAERSGLSVSRAAGAADFADFVQLHDRLLHRKGFAVELEAAFYASVQDSLDESERFQVFLAFAEGRPAAGAVVSFLGDTAVYLLGATAELGLQTKASYLLQWAILNEARSRGCRWYDLGGIDPDANPGVYHFKQGLGGLDVTVPGPYELAPPGLRSAVTSACERLYRALRRRPRPMPVQQ